jgi:hypothetical protein
MSGLVTQYRAQIDCKGGFAAKSFRRRVIFYAVVSDEIEQVIEFPNARQGRRDARDRARG